MRVMFLSIHGYVDPIPDLGQVDTGGQVVYVIEIAKRLAKMGVQVDIYTRWFEGRKKVEQINRNARIIRIPCGPNHFLRKEELFPFLDEFAENLVRFVKKENIRYDLMHSHYWDAGYVALKIRSVLGVKHVHTSHSLGAIKKERIRIKEAEKIYHFKNRIKWEKKIIEVSHMIIVTSPLEPEIIEKYYGVKRDTEIIPPGVNTEFFSPSNIKEDLDLPDKFVFTTGRIEYTKGFDLLIKAFKLVSSRIPSAKLIIGGGSKNLTELETKIRKELMQLSQALGLSGAVKQTGRIPNELLPTYYARANAVAVPSRYDLFGMVALEALACESPVVVSKYAGVSKYITNEIGLVGDPENSEDFAEKILFLLDNEDIANEMGRNGRRFVLNNFTWDKIAEKIIHAYKKII